MTGNEVWKLLNDISRKIFEIDLGKIDRNLYGYTYELNKPNQQTHIIKIKHLFGLESRELTFYLNKQPRTSFNKAAVVYDLDLGNNQRMKNIDVLFISDVVLNTKEEIQYGTLLHELCHYILYCKFELPFELNAICYSQGQNLKKITRFNNSDTIHTLEWFALLYKSAHLLYKNYPKIFKGHNHAVYNSIFYDVEPKSEKIDYKILLKGIKWLR